MLADLLSWILEKKGISPLIHYLDDFLTIGQADSAACQNHLHNLGIPLALEKLEGPSQCLTFLGITLDTQLMEARLPSDKLLRIRNQLSAWLTRKRATKREILSLVGLLQHACKVVRPGRSFVLYRRQTKATISLHPPQQRLQIRSALVACLCHHLEWDKLPTCPFPSSQLRLHYPN